MEKTITVDGRKIPYLEQGKGDPLVLLPGLGSDCYYWKDIIPLLAKHYHVYAASFPVYGAKSKEGFCYTFETLPYFLKKFLDKLKIKKPILLGHCLGAMVSMIYAANNPKEVKKLIMVSAPLTDHKKPLPLLWRLAVKLVLKKPKITERVLKSLLKRKNLFKVISRILPLEGDAKNALVKTELFFKNFPPKATAVCYNDLFKMDFRNHIAKLKISTLIIYGSEDKVLKRFRGTSLYSLVPNAKTISLPCGHFVPTDLPHDLARLALEFIKKPYLPMPGFRRFLSSK